MTIDTMKNMHLLIPLINKHFDEHYKYSGPLVAWSVDIHFSLYEESEMIGCIGGQRIKLQIYDKEYDASYVDWLTIAKKHRGKNLAPVLISHMAPMAKVHLLKKTSDPLPFLPVCKYQYFGRRLGEFNDFHVAGMRVIKHEDYSKAYEFYHRWAEQFPMHVNFTLEQFKAHFLAALSISTCVRYNVNNEMACLASFVVYKWHGRYVAELVCFLSDDPVHDFQSVCYMAHAHSLPCVYMVAPNVGINDKFIKHEPLKMQPGYISYFHLYNYQLTEQMKPSELLIPLL